jgi:hypothetical protein
MKVEGSSQHHFWLTFEPSVQGQRGGPERYIFPFRNSSGWIISNYRNRRSSMFTGSSDVVMDTGVFKGRRDRLLSIGQRNRALWSASTSFRDGINLLCVRFNLITAQRRHPYTAKLMCVHVFRLYVKAHFDFVIRSGIRVVSDSALDQHNILRWKQ